MKYTKGYLTVKIEDEFDDQGTKHTNLQVYSGADLIDEMIFNIEDMGIIKDALVRYFDHAR